MIDWTTQVALERQLIARTLIDTCQLIPSGSVTTDDRGISTETPAAAREYNGSDVIPCLRDTARAFINDHMKFQDVVTDNLLLYLPYDVTIDETDEVVYNGDRFKIRKLIRAGNMDATTEALLFSTDKAQ